jgi:predicted RecB family nuclease
VAGARSGALTRIPGLLPEQAVLLQGAGVQDVAALARSDPHDLARRTVFPLHQVEPWVFAAQFLELPGVSGSEAAALARAGVRGPMDLARTNPAFLAERTGAPLPKAERWVRAARAAAAAPA